MTNVSMVPIHRLKNKTNIDANLRTNLRANIGNRTRLAVAGVITLAGLAGFPGLSGGVRAQGTYLLQGGSLISGLSDRVLVNHVVLVRGGTISGAAPKKKMLIPEDVKVIDVSGKFILPGLIDVNAPAVSPDDLARYLRWGITTVNTASVDPAAAVSRDRGTNEYRVRSPRIVANAELGGGSPSRPWTGSADEAAALIGSLVPTRVPRITITYDDMSWHGGPRSGAALDADAFATAVRQARESRITPYVRAPQLAMASGAVQAGIRGLMNGIVDDRVDAGIVSTMAGNDVFYAPTFSYYKSIADPDAFIREALSDPRFAGSLDSATIAALTGGAYRDRIRQAFPDSARVASKFSILESNLTTMANNYAQVALGSGVDVLPGIASHLELEAMVDAGLTPLQAILSATFMSAKMLNLLERVGVIDEGKEADIIILDADPLADIRNTRSISMVIRKGIIYTPADFSPGAAAPK